jgi:RNA polymerase sigma factor (sigma-70 family)
MIAVTLRVLLDTSPMQKAIRGGALIDERSRFEAMYREHEPAVLAYALRRSSVEIAQDAVAEVFLVAWCRLDELPAQPLPWLIGATRKALANQRRAAARQSLLADRITSAAQTKALDVMQIGGSRVREALARLSEIDREALILIGWDGLTPSEAAASLGCTAVAFRVRFHRARRRFARALAQLDRLDQIQGPAPAADARSDLEEVV